MNYTCTVITGDYDHVDSFHEGLSAVRSSALGNRLGFIDKTGKTAIPLDYYGKVRLSEEHYKYAELSYFSDGLAAVMNRNGKFGYIDKTGNTVIPFEYDSASLFENGEAFVIKENVMKKINPENKVIASYPQGDAVFFNEELTGIVRNGKLGFFNGKGDMVVPFEYDYKPGCTESGFSEGFSAVSENGELGYIDKKGKKVIAFGNKYSGLKRFKNGYAIVSSGGEKERRYGLINRDGKEVIAPEYNKIYGQAESMMTAVKNGVCGYLDLKNGIFVPTVYEEIICIGNDRLIVRKGEKYGVIDGNGSEVIPFEYNKLRAFKNGYAAAEMNGKWGYISEGGVKVTLFEYDYADDFCDGAAVIKKENVFKILKFK